MNDEESGSSQEDNQVRLYIYDMSKGLAKMISKALLGKHIDGIWHTAIVVYGREYYYGGGGIASVMPGSTVLGWPTEIKDLGKTQIPYSLFLEYIFGLGETTYPPDKYHLFEHNCNNFTHEVSTFLTGEPIPEYVLNLPKEVLNTPLGETLRAVLEPLNLRGEGGRGVTFGHQTVEDSQRRQVEGTEETHSSSDFQEDDDIREIMATLKLSKEEAAAAKEANSNKEPRSPTTGDAPATNGETAPKEGEDGDSGAWESRLAAKRAQKNQDPPIVYKDVDAQAAFEVFEKTIAGSLSDEEIQLISELKEFVISDSGAWALGGQHLEYITHILADSSCPKEARRGLLQFLQAAALKEDVILLLHMDRREHLLMNWVNDFEKMDADEQEEIAKLICNLCLPYSASDWLLYISEWQTGNQSISNSRVTTRVAVNSLLSNIASLQDKGVSLMYNLGLKEVFDDTATELASAILQYLHGDVQEEPGFKVLTALSKFMHISYKDVPALVKMLGPDLGKFKGKSDRLDHLVEQIAFKVSNVGLDGL